VNVIKNVEVPKIKSKWVMSKGDIWITSADEATFNVLQNISRNRQDIREVDLKWPMMTVFDVETSLPESEIPDHMSNQSSKLCIPESDAEKVLKPVFRIGLRGKQEVK